MQWIIYGVLMILIVYFLPKGIVPALRNWWQGRQQQAASETLGAPAGTGAAR